MKFSISLTKNIINNVCNQIQIYKSKGKFYFKRNFALLLLDLKVQDRHEMMNTCFIEI